ncbi:hypothetical protein NL676_016386 [Syzygium grande]|nr:hypothetical protein NL676_016386 [Syzygium grande]
MIPFSVIWQTSVSPACGSIHALPAVLQMRKQSDDSFLFKRIGLSTLFTAFCNSELSISAFSSLTLDEGKPF